MRILNIQELEAVAGAGSSDEGWWDLTEDERQRILADEAAAEAAQNRLPDYQAGAGGGAGDTGGGGYSDGSYYRDLWDMQF
ncbi:MULTISPECIES: hypothetical protein [Janthinobacterium]|uniref:Uncharacterized protein n=1 Tax=Janthinobacterium kumbetense TaxID=2950280 RepID=A0ABT0WQ74_9BURK|nr:MULTISPECIES: hypothetical protein [Janthinobacterium]MCM2566137.1 hypothetical protein [Janthinobacterium kumbetense]MDN2679313.1 hypothetical protein [Janthinobacterium sp. SUN033]MDO8068937.1 hypothetical protein [Janthinobacterium sp. SUN206]MDO8074354.1 hypothetical protein [Janthinobacterium sp. SUN176]MED5615947.1 hypothetical protein [Janthinobacterium sp. P210005]